MNRHQIRIVPHSTAGRKKKTFEQIVADRKTAALLAAMPVTRRGGAKLIELRDAMQIDGVTVTTDMLRRMVEHLRAKGIPIHSECVGRTGRVRIFRFYWTPTPALEHILLSVYF